MRVCVSISAHNPFGIQITLNRICLACAEVLALLCSWHVLSAELQLNVQQDRQIKFSKSH